MAPSWVGGLGANRSATSTSCSVVRPVRAAARLVALFLNPSCPERLAGRRRISEAARIMRYLTGAVFAVLAFVTAAPSVGLAQGLGAATVVGVVRDASGAVLPGVTVEASSPVLIEKVRSTVSDAEGRYQIAELRPGTYAVTFTLPGFTTFRRDGLELTSNFAAT